LLSRRLRGRKAVDSASGPLNPGSQLVRSAELGQKDRCGFIERGTAAQAEHRLAASPFRRKLCFGQYRSIGIAICRRNVVNRSNGLGVFGLRDSTGPRSPWSAKSLASSFTVTLIRLSRTTSSAPRSRSACANSLEQPHRCGQDEA
jgi:hypothetical protein